ncbi:immunoglobulin-like domain-containing protein [Listeria kieliensis]
MKKTLKRASKVTAIALVTASVGFSSVYPVQAAQANPNENNLTKAEQKIIEEGKQKAAKIELTDKQKKEVQENTRATNLTADKSITTLMLRKRNTSTNLKTELTYKAAPNAESAYDGGTINLTARAPLQGNVYNRSILPTNGIEHIKNFQNGNFGARVNLVFPKGVDAKSMIDTVDWEASEKSLKDTFWIKAIGIPTPVKLLWGMKYERQSIQIDPQRPNEFSIMVRGIKKSEVSDAEWDKYNPLVTESALAFVGAIPGGGVLGNMDGWAEISFKFDMSKYRGNTDDITKDRQLTAKRLFPDNDRNAKVTVNVLDQNSLMAGAEGEGDIGKSEVKPGHEHDNPQVSNGVSTWDSYLSIWDNEQVYNTNQSEEDLVIGEKNALPGATIFNRDLAVKKGENFNDFKPNRFNRVINYFTKENVTTGHTGTINDVVVSHTPSKVTDGTTKVKYTGHVTYTNGDTRQLIPNTLNVTNNTQPATEGTITPDTFTIGDSNITGKYTGDVKTLRLYINGVSVAWGGSLQDGKFTFYAGNQKITANDKLTMNAYDKDNNLLQENVPVNVKEEAAATGSIDPAMYTPGDTNITGTYTGNVAHAKLFVNGNYVSAGGDFSNGVFTYYAGGKIKAGDKAYLVAMDKTGKELDRKDIKINASSETTGSINPSAYTVGENTISGSYTGNVALMHLLVNGKSISWGGTLSNGSFSYYVKAGTIKAGDIVTLEAYDQNNNKLDSKRVQVNGKATSGSIDSATYKLGETTIKGTFSGDIAVAKVYINGVAQAWGGEFGGGGFSYYVGKNKIKAGDNVTIEGYNKDTKLLDTKKVTILN